MRPHDFERAQVINYVVRLSRTSKYVVYRIANRSAQREALCVLPVREPAYMHSFGMTENYVILAEFPLVVNPLRLLLSGKPFIENYEWKPDQGTRFILIDKKDGSARSYNAEAFFAFHHVNAFEEKGEVFVDIAAYRDPEIITALYLENLQAGKPIPSTELRRYRLPAQGKAADFELLSSEPLELPRLNYKRHNGKAYRYAYGVGVRRAGGFADQLVKVDVRERTAKLWWEENSYPGEPVFIARPGAVAEDDGVILSVVLEASTGTSFLLMLDAASFTELARAEVPHHIPFGLHGQFFEK